MDERLAQAIGEGWSRSGPQAAVWLITRRSAPHMTKGLLTWADALSGGPSFDRRDDRI